MIAALIAHLRQQLARVLRVGPYRPEYQRAEAEAAAKTRAYYAWTEDPPAFINQMKDADEVLRWLADQINTCYSEWPRGPGGDFDSLMNGLERSRFGGRFSDLIKGLKDYRHDPYRVRDLLHRRMSKA